jgi:hypothetical protein
VVLEAQVAVVEEQMVLVPLLLVLLTLVAEAAVAVITL